MQTALLSSLPDGTRVIYMSPASSPVFQIRFCQRLSSKHGEAPIKTLPRDCWRYAAKGYPCSCGTITYIGSPFSFTPSLPPSWFLWWLYSSASSRTIPRCISVSLSSHLSRRRWARRRGRAARVRRWVGARRVQGWLSAADRA